MNFKDFEDFQKKFRTNHRDDMYHVIREKDQTGMFSSVVNTFLMAFAMGFHLKRREPLRSGAINHVNASNTTVDQQDVIILLMLNRHPEITTSDELWSMVEEYAEGGIIALYDSLSISEWVLDVQSILGKDKSSQR